MQDQKSDIIIIGAGLTGLTLAYLLKNEGFKIHILESRSRIGGRIYSVHNQDLAPVEMGATWFGPKHSQINRLLHELGLNIFEQELGENAIYEPLSTSPPQLVQLPPNGEDASFRIKNGTTSLPDALNKNLGDLCEISFNQKVKSITNDELGVIVNTGTVLHHANIVVSTLPPYLLLKTIEFTPKLQPVLTSLMKETHTWMGDSIKIGLHYTEPFWRSPNLSGTIFSNVGPIPEMYEHANFEGSKFALKGFLNGAYHSVTKNERLELILNQLRRYYGSKADDYIHYEEMIWCKDSNTYHPYESDLLPHQNNGHPMFQTPICDGKFHIGGSETASEFPGYMEGAILSAKHIANAIKNQVPITD